MTRILRSIMLACVVAMGFGIAAAESTVLLNVDFSEKATAGSEASPQMFKYTTEITGTTGLGLSGWSVSSASKLGQAGGAIYISDGAYLRTPYIAGVSLSNGAIKVTLTVKLRNTNMGIAQIAWVSTSYNAEIVTGDWTTVEYIITPTSTSSYSNYAKIQPFLVADGMLVKSVKIEQSTDFLTTPVTSLPTDANGTSFTASWKAVTGATKYFLDVYSYDAEGKKVMFIENKEVTPESTTAKTVSYKVEGLNATTTYYYVVRAANDNGGVSSSSAEVEVVKAIASLDTPVVTVEAQADGNFTASWGSVANAEAYLVNVICRQTMKEGGMANVLTENFNVFSSGSISNYNYAYDRHLAMLSEEGWTGKDMIYINGAIGLSPYSANTSYLQTPALKLADDNGKVTVVLKAAAGKIGSFAATGSLKLALVDAEGNVGQVDSIVIDAVGFKEYTVELQGGTNASCVKIFDTIGDTSVRYYFDEITVKQNKPAGYVNTTNFASAETVATNYSGKVDVEEGKAYYITVTAGARTVSGGALSTIFSDASQEKEIGNSGTVGVESIVVEAAAVKALANGIVEVTAVAPTTVTVYNVAGAQIAAVNVPAGVSFIEVNAKGLLIVKAGNAVTKLAL